MNFGSFLVRIVAVSEFLSFVLQKLDLSAVSDVLTVIVLAVAIIDAFGLVKWIALLLNKHWRIIIILLVVFAISISPATASIRAPPILHCFNGGVHISYLKWLSSRAVINHFTRFARFMVYDGARII